MLKPSLQLKLGQQLTMTPQLQQAIRLLQLPALELQAHIRELLETNVMLEPTEEAESTGTFEVQVTAAEHSQPAERIGLAPPDCVFVDDLRENCEGAEAVGMTAVLHRETDRTLDRLEELLGVPLRDGA